MPTLLTPQAFENLTDIRKIIATNKGLRTLGTPMRVFVPWARSTLESSRGIYYLGAGLDASEDPDNPETFEAALEKTEQFVQSGMQGRRASPFWNFLDGLTAELLGGPSDTVSDRWGWSNLLKIGWSRGSPAK